MSAVRRSLMNTKKSGALPYDAEVEYIESSGTQYIDTLFKHNQDTRMITKIEFVTTGWWKYPFGSYGNVSSNKMMFCLELNAGKILCTYYKDRTHEFHIDANGIHTFDLNKNIHNVDSSSYTYPYSSFQSHYNDLLFGITDYNGVIQIADLKLRCFYFKIYDNGTLVRDYIPVRVGQIGYMYDKVSGELFGNAGTGDFILGNDIN